MNVITRFAPSPTGYLHIGGARTALFNYLFAKKNNGKFLLRIEDTDKTRSTKEATSAIFSGLEWLGLTHDGDVVFQSQRIDEHRKAAMRLLKEQKAYYCYASQEEIDAERARAMQNKEHFIFHSPWRDADPSSYPKDKKPAIRLKAPRLGDTVIHDQLQGDVIVANDHLDDMILLRSDGSPTYMLAVVVDDHDMGITHIIRGDDHLTNAARQIILYRALGYDVPVMVHIPLIYGQDGTKLSKRHGALGIDVYKEMGFLPEALCNYLLRLGWAHKDDEVISREQAIEWFGIEGLGKSPARLDMTKMRSLNAIYLRKMDNHELTKIAMGLLGTCHPELDSGSNTQAQKEIPNQVRDDDSPFAYIYNNIYKAMDSIKLRCEITLDLAALAKIYLPQYNIIYSDELKEIIANCDQEIIASAIYSLTELADFTKENIQNALKTLAQSKEIKIGKLMEPLRILLTGRTDSPSVFELIEIIGKEETLRRICHPELDSGSH
jgi:glutamyl-tRNA synthetase